MGKKKLSNNTTIVNDFFDNSLLESTMEEFYVKVANLLSESRLGNDDTWDLDNYPLLPHQAMYVVNYLNDVSFSYLRGFTELFGYDENELTPNILHEYLHPSQSDILTRILKGAVNYGINNNNDFGEDTWMSIIYKARKKDNSYIPVIRQTSIYERDENGRMISSFSIISDLTGLNNAEKVEWIIKGPHVNEKKFKDFIYKAYSGFFTEREKEILKLIEQGNNSLQVGKYLNISKNTVDTHRRNMLSKANCSNTLELLTFARKNGLLN